MAQPIDLVLAAFKAFDARDVHALLALAASDMELRVPATGALANGGQAYRGHEGLRRYFADVSSVWRELKLVPHRYGAREKLVAIVGRVYGLDTQGAIFDSPAGWLWRVHGASIASARAFGTHEERLDAAGLVESELQPLARPALAGL